MAYRFVLWFALACCAAAPVAFAQNFQSGSVSGSFQIDAQYYLEDSVIGTPQVDEKMRMNAYGNIDYSLGGFQAGIRYEAYLPKPLLGIDENYANNGIATRYASYTTDKFSITIGNFYEQFGSGSTLRAWWEPLLGYDNSIDGVRVTGNPYKGIYLKGVWGRQRYFWETSAGVVRGGDAEIDLAELLDTLWKPKWRVRFGGSVVSKFQEGKELFVDDFVYDLPENTAAFSGRANFQYKTFTLRGEYTYRGNDPQTTNNLIYRPGQALLLSTSWYNKNFGFSLDAKRLDNMDFRSDRFETGQNLQINFLPPNAKQHTYRLPTLYLYATQFNGEMGIQGEVFYRIPKGSKLGGKYGTQITLNYARIHNIDSTATNDAYGYESDFLAVGEEVYYSDFNVSIYRKFSKKVKATLTYLELLYDRDVILGQSGYGLINAHAGILDVTYNFDYKRSIRGEFQWMVADQIEDHTESDFGDWVMLLLEYNVSPHWFVSVSDEYNYGNPKENLRVHYYSAMFGYLWGSSRVSLTYGRIREGINCAGGICRIVPSMNGFFLSVSSTF